MDGVEVQYWAGQIKLVEASYRCEIKEGKGAEIRYPRTRLVENPDSWCLGKGARGGGDSRKGGDGYYCIVCMKHGIIVRESKD